MTAALLTAWQWLYAGVEPEISSPAAPQKSLTPGAAIVAEHGEETLPPVAEDDHITVPVSEAVNAAAELLRPRGATLDQTVAAMVRLNPGVFQHGDLRHVAFPHPLNIPSVGDILEEDPDGLALLLLEVDKLAAALPEIEIDDNAASPKITEDPPDQAVELNTPAEPVTAAPQTAVDTASMLSGKVVMTAAAIALLLFSLLWMLLRFGGKSAGYAAARSISTSRRLLRHTVGGAPATDESPSVLDVAGDEGMLQQFNLPAEYLDDDDVGVLLQRVVAEFPDASRQVIQLMHFFQQREDSVNFLRQHQRLLENYFYQRHPEVWSVINQYAADLGLKLNATASADNSAMLDARLLELQSRVEIAEHARREAERRASVAEQEFKHAEQEASDAELALREMQLRLDFGEMESH